LEFFHEVAEAVVQIDAQLRERCGVFRQQILEKHPHGMAKENRVGDLHHRSLEMQREEHALGFRLRDLLLVELDQRLFAHDRAVDDFASFQRGLVF
jgi:hypothetical protein